MGQGTNGTCNPAPGSLVSPTRLGVPHPFFVVLYLGRVLIIKCWFLCWFGLSDYNLWSVDITDTRAFSVGVLLVFIFFLLISASDGDDAGAGVDLWVVIKMFVFSWLSCALPGHFSCLFCFLNFYRNQCASLYFPRLDHSRRFFRREQNSHPYLTWCCSCSHPADTA